jgi:hypothetical protein
MYDILLEDSKFQETIKVKYLKASDGHLDQSL